MKGMNPMSKKLILAEAPSYGQPITEYAPRSRGAKVYDDLAKEVLKAHGKRLQK